MQKRSAVLLLSVSLFGLSGCSHLDMGNFKNGIKSGKAEIAADTPQARLQ